MGQPSLPASHPPFFPCFLPFLPVSFLVHALVSTLRNLPLGSDQESQEAGLPERGTELPAAHRQPRRWDLGLRSRARGAGGRPGLLGRSQDASARRRGWGGCCQAQSVPSTGILGGRGADFPTWKQERGEAEQLAGFGRGAGGGLSLVPTPFLLEQFPLSPSFVVLICFVLLLGRWSQVGLWVGESRSLMGCYQPEAASVSRTV